MFLSVCFSCLFSEDTIAKIASADELAAGAIIAQDGLAIPPLRFPVPSRLGSRPSPANVIGPGKF